MKKLIYLIAITIFIAGCAKDSGIGEEEMAAGNISGSVIVNGEPVNGAAVLLTPGGGTKITGSDGMYSFLNLKAGRYEIKVYKEEFQSFNKSIEITNKNEELAITLTKSTGNLSINKAYIDMGSSESNNVAGFSLLNKSNTELSWQITNAAGWIKTIDPQNGTVLANSSAAVTFTLDRSKLSSTNMDNYATLVIRSMTAGDGSTAELLITVFGSGNGTNTVIDSNDEYVILGDLFVQTKNQSDAVLWTSANSLCNNSIVGGYNDWRLPTIDELATLYTKKDAIGGFMVNGWWRLYWSGTTNNYGSNYIVMNFGTGEQINNLSTGGISCRCVRKSSPLPIVSTLSVTNIMENDVTLNGKIENQGEPAYTEKGFVYSNIFRQPTIEDDINSTTKKVVSGTNFEFQANISGLTTNTIYYVRAYAINSNGVVYGDVLNFTPSNPDFLILEHAKLMVQRQDIGAGCKTDMVSMCENLFIGGYTDWRLPTLDELFVLYNNREFIDGFSTDNTGGNPYWSSSLTTNSSYPNYVLYFNDGSSGSWGKCTGSYNTRYPSARAVRTL